MGEVRAGAVGRYKWIIHAIAKKQEIKLNDPKAQKKVEYHRIKCEEREENYLCVWKEIKNVTFLNSGMYRNKLTTMELILIHFDSTIIPVKIRI